MGYNNCLLSKDEFGPSAITAWNALIANQQDNGMVCWSQNIGFDPRIASSNSRQNYGTGAFY
jgi:hypothetical protein